MKSASALRQLSFQSRLERLAPGIEYYAVVVPAKITQALGTRASVPVTARVNDSTPFLGSLYTRGAGRHGMRIKASVRQATGIKEGDRVRVHITVRDRQTEVSVPRDLAAALRAEGLVESFAALPVGQRSFTLRRIEQAVQPQTRDKRIRAALKDAREKRQQVKARSS